MRRATPLAGGGEEWGIGAEAAERAGRRRGRARFSLNAFALTLYCNSSHLTAGGRKHITVQSQSDSRLTEIITLVVTAHVTAA